MELFSKKTYATIFLSLLFIVASILLHNYQNPELKLFATPINLPEPLGIGSVNDSEFVYSNGRYFVKYNIDSKRTENLSSETILPLPSVNSVQVAAGGDYVLFQSVNQSTSDKLGKILAEKKINTVDVASFWWVLDTKNNSFLPLDARDTASTEDSPTTNESPFYVNDPASNISAVFSVDGSHVHILSQHEDQSRHIVTFITSSGEKVSDINVPSDTESFTVDERNFIIVSNKKMITINRAGKKTSEHPNELSLLISPIFNRSNVAIGYVKTDNQDGNLIYKIDTQTGKKKLLKNIDEETSQILSQDGSMVSYIQNKQIHTEAPGFISRTYKINLVEKSPIKLEFLDIAMIFDKDRYIATDTTTGKAYLLTAKPTAFQVITTPNYKIEGRDDWSLWYDSEARYFSANIVAEPSLGVKNEIYKVLQENKIDPDKIHVEFTYSPPGLQTTPIDLTPYY